MKVYRLPIFYKHYAVVDIEADNIEEAVSMFNSGAFDDQVDDETIPEPDSSWMIDRDALDEYEEDEDG